MKWAVFVVIFNDCYIFFEDSKFEHPTVIFFIHTFVSVAHLFVRASANISIVLIALKYNNYNNTNTGYTLGKFATTYYNIPSSLPNSFKQTKSVKPHYDCIILCYSHSTIV